MQSLFCVGRALLFVSLLYLVQMFVFCRFNLIIINCHTQKGKIKFIPREKKYIFYSIFIMRQFSWR